MSLAGFATFYYLPGFRTAYGEQYDATALTAAMTPDRAPKNAQVRVQREDDPAKSITVRINDTGPYARGFDGQPVRPLQPDPDIIVDLTPAGFELLTGGLRYGKVRVVVEVMS